MTRWRHPRIFERLRCLGLCLFATGLAFHNADNPPAALAAIVVTGLLVVRLRIELAIGQNEEESSLERKLHRIHQVNTVILFPVGFGVLAILKKLETGDNITVPFVN